MIVVLPVVRILRHGVVASLSLGVSPLPGFLLRRILPPRFGVHQRTQNSATSPAVPLHLILVDQVFRR